MAGNYCRELVERLVPAVWDEVFAYGMTDPRRPSPDMPKGFVDKKKGSSLFAHLADIRQAWKHCDLTLVERQALLLHIGMDQTVALSAHLMGVHHSTVSRRCESGIGKLTAWLNGDEYVDGYDAEELVEIA